MINQKLQEQKKKSLKVVLTKCYYVEVIDDTRERLADGFCYADRKIAEEYGKRMKNEIAEKIDNGEIYWDVLTVHPGK